MSAIAIFYAQLSQTFGMDISTTIKLCKNIGFNTEQYIIEGGNTLIQSLYLNLAFFKTYEYYGQQLHKASAILFGFITAYSVIALILYIYFIRSSYIKNGLPYITIINSIGSLIALFSVGPILFATSLSCSVSFIFQNIAIWMWFLTFLGRTFIIFTRSFMAKYSMDFDAKMTYSRRFWIFLAANGFGNETYVCKLILLLSPLGFIPGAVPLAFGTPTFISELGVCVFLEKNYLFCIITLILLSVVLIFNLIGFKYIRNDIYCIKFQTIVYAFILPGVGIYTAYFLSNRTYFVSTLRHYSNCLYALLVFVIFNVTACNVIPLLVILYKHYNFKVAPEQKTSFKHFCDIFVSKKGWERLCNFSIRSFTEENALFINEYEKLLLEMRKSGYVFCSRVEEDSYIFNDFPAPKLEKVKLDKSFNARYHCLLTYNIPNEKVLIYDTEPNEAQKEILIKAYDKFFKENAPYELNIPFDINRAIRKRFTENNLSCLMMEEIKNLVITLLYENTFLQLMNSNPESTPTSAINSISKDEELSKSHAQIRTTAPLEDGFTVFDG